MNIKLAKEIIEKFIKTEIESYSAFLEDSHPLLVDHDLGDIKEAYDLLKNHYNLFEGD